MAELPSAPASSPLAGTSSTGAAHARRILVVEDYEDNRELYATYLSLQGFEVLTAENGAQALECVRESSPDVILMDLSLPVLSGWDAIRELKMDPHTRGIPILALTGHATPTHKARAQEAGADDFAAKPCPLQDVEQRILDLLKGPSSRLGEVG
ncbi:response regulator [Hyalangium minutum]|uniref:Signal transduction response regulator n=1 Tax=Hyalangium minutum TaxID=394096 RepID=A0A085WAT8_9BACT|nr:response regulator [Hyalangium minutum]KFE64801.1 Signal transduction response regulator [Hyalangium minutum]